MKLQSDDSERSNSLAACFNNLVEKLSITFLDDNLTTIGIVGHQPSLQELAFILVASYAEGCDKVLNSNFSTSNAILILLNIKRWDQIAPRVGILADYFDSKIK